MRWDIQGHLGHNNESAHLSTPCFPLCTNSLNRPPTHQAINSPHFTAGQTEAQGLSDLSG